MIEVNGSNLERILNDRTHPGVNQGYIKEAVPNQVFLNNAGTLAALTARGTGTVGLLALGIGYVWSFEATADQTKKLVFKGKLPQDFKLNVERDGERCSFIARAKVRKVGAGTDNTDLRLSSQLIWHNDGIVTTEFGQATEGNGDTAHNGVTISDTALHTLPAQVVSGAEEAFRWMEWDFTSAMTAAQRSAMKPGADYAVEFFPHEAVGTGIDVQIAAVELFYRGHLIAQDRFWKNKVLK